MTRCRFCGMEFDGNFCPNCGKKRQEAFLCPHCGARVAENWKFCAECGLPADPGSPAFGAKFSPDKTKSLPSQIKNFLQKAVRFAPDLLLLLFSLMSFLFYLAPVAVIPGGEIFGEKFPAESFGNLYQLINSIGESLLVPLLIIPIVTAFSTLFAAVNLFSSKKRRAGVVLRCLFYLFFIVYPSVIVAVINSTDEGTGLMEAGSCFKLVLSFSVIFFVLSLACDLYFFLGPAKQTSAPTSVRLTLLRSETSDVISDNEYSERDDLYSVKITRGIRRIGKEAFRDCLKLSSVSAEEGLTVISDNAFLGCASLKEVALPASLREIGWYAFCNCSALEKIVFNGTTEQWEHICKGGMWNDSSGEYLIACSDGTLPKEPPSSFSSRPTP